MLSHLRWSWVWQRPQQLISRIARVRRMVGARIWFVEEPMFGDVAEPTLQTVDVDGVTRVWMVVPVGDRDPEQHIGFSAVQARGYGQLLIDLLDDAGSSPRRDVWLYTPMALDLAVQLAPARLIYDVMDDLAAFDHAPEGLPLLQRRALTEATIVFTGGRSLHRSVLAHRRHDVHLFASGVETAHYATAAQLRRPHDRMVAGYVGVIDERLDLQMIGRLAELLPEWQISMVGPTAKIDPADLPRAANIEYIGFVGYDQLPSVMATFDVALMPFALNNATRSISPTKTLEYLAAGLPVVSTRVPDVVSEFGDVVQLADDATGFAQACRGLAAGKARSESRLDALLHRHEWNTIAGTMNDMVRRCAAAPADAVVAEENAR